MINVVSFSLSKVWYDGELCINEGSINKYDKAKANVVL